MSYIFDGEGFMTEMPYAICHDISINSTQLTRPFCC